MGRFIDVVFNLPTEQAFTYSLPDGVECAAGVRVIAPLGKRNRAGFVIGVGVDPPQQRMREIVRIIDRDPIFGDWELRLAHWLSRMYCCSLGEALAAMLPTGRRESNETASGSAPDLTDTVVLTAEQRRAIDIVIGEDRGRFYLSGVTGSGKTEVFLQLTRSLLDEGYGAIYLTPEIALTQQVTAIIRRRFHRRVAVIHSRLTPSQRLREWRRIRSGEARIVVGARSAIFAPVHRLALIIVDEEHEGSYKSSSTPRYHARQVALRRCADEGARLLLGSATPSVEAWMLMQEKRLRRIDLVRRPAGGAPPSIQIVDMGMTEGLFSPQLEEALLRVKRMGRQSILLLNRRGFAHVFHCRSCGYHLHCQRCAVAMTYHKRRHAMLCHYCGYSCPPLDVCPECGSLDVGYGTPGIERVEQEIAARFPDLSFRRVDSDTMQRRQSLEEAIEEFRRGDLDLLMGTQMVAKGLNFPGLKLVGILQADNGLSMPDFRAQERVFALVTQVAGRCGRYLPDGEVIIQTFRPDNAAIRCAATGDMRQFYEQELATRKLLSFPPYSRLFRLVFRGRTQTKVSNAARDFAQIVASLTGASNGASIAELLGPAECPVAMISHNYRYQLLLRTTTFDATHAALREALNRFRTPSSIYLEVDVDPVSMI